MKRIGFIGVGAIAEAVVSGLLSTENAPQKIVLSPRNADRAASLAEQFSQVEVAPSNQAVIDASDVVCLAVRPQVAEEILNDLIFREDVSVVSFIATFDIGRLEKLVTPARNISRMVPIPTVAKNLGPVVLSPPNEEIKAVFQDIGRIVEVQNEEQFQALWAATAMMAPYFGLLDSVSKWLKDQGLSEKDADSYVGSLFHAISDTGLSVNGEGFEGMAVDHATAGGLNEQLMRELKDSGCYENVSKGLSLIFDRLNGRANFSDTIH